MQHALILLMLLLAAGAPAQEAAAPQQEAVPTVRTPAPIMTFLGAGWLERPERVEEEKPDEVIAAMKLKPGDVVADIGVGTGFFARRMARQVAPDGFIYGVDVQQKMLDMLKGHCVREKIENIKPILGSDSTTNLPDASCDWMLLVDTYHEFQDAEAMLADMLRALKPGGKVALLEYRLLGETAAHIKVEHRMSVEQVKAEWIPAGFELVEILEFLPAQHYFIFRKPE